MRYLITIVIAALSLNAFGQTDGWEYPFPYNPDGNADGYISLDDMLDLLAIYGQQYPESFYTDTTRAALNLGEMGAHSCLLQAKAAGQDWRMISDIDILYFSQLVFNLMPVPSNNNDVYYSWFWDTTTNSPDRIEIYSSNINFSSCSAGTDCIYNSDSTAYATQFLRYYNESPGNIMTNRQCILVSEVRPKIDYKCIDIAYSEYEAEANLLIEQGYLPIGGPTNHGGANKYFGCFWRWAVE